MSSAAVVIRRQNRLIQLFNQLGAIDQEHAIDLNDVGIRRSFIFVRMCDRGVFIQCSNGKYFIDNRAVELFKENRRKRAFYALLVILILLAVFCLFGGLNVV